MDINYAHSQTVFHINVVKTNGLIKIKKIKIDLKFLSYFPL